MNTFEKNKAVAMRHLFITTAIFIAMIPLLGFVVYTYSEDLGHFFPIIMGTWIVIISCTVGFTHRRIYHTRLTVTSEGVEEFFKDRKILEISLDEIKGVFFPKNKDSSFWIFAGNTRHYVGGYIKQEDIVTCLKEYLGESLPVKYYENTKLKAVDFILYSLIVVFVLFMVICKLFFNDLAMDLITIVGCCVTFLSTIVGFVQNRIINTIFQKDQ